MNGSSKGDLIKKGQVLIRQGEEPRYMYYMHSGALEILSAPTEYEELHTDILLSKSKRVGTIKERNLISGLSILFDEPYKKSIRTIEDSYVSKYPIKEGGFQQLVMDNTPLSADVLSNLFRRFELSMPDASRYANLYQNIARLNDNLCLMYKALSQGALPEKLEQRANALHDTYVLNGGGFPGSFDAKFLIADNADILRKKYSFPGLPMETILDLKQCNFINKILKLDTSVLIGVVKRDPSIATYMFETISENLLKVLDRIEAIHTLIDEELSVLFGPEGSWTNVLIDSGTFAAWQLKGRVSADFLKNFLSIAVKIHSFFEELSGKKLSEAFPGFKKLHEFYVSQKDLASAGEGHIQRKASSFGSKYANSIQQIFEFSLIDKEFQNNFLKVLNDFKKMQNPFNTEPEGRKIRRFITKLYLDLYKQVLLRSQSEPVLPPPVRLMLNFGFLDETMLEQDQMEELHEISTRTGESTGIPIYYEYEFLRQIYDAKENPSITEMGLSYEAHLREEEKHKKSSKSKKSSEDEENINKMMFEVDHRLLNTITVCSGSSATAFPILTSMVMRGNPANFYISKKKLESTILALREIDFSAYYRETVERMGEAREIIQDEVIPNFILLPSFGTKTMLWQELDGTNRRTRGRIVIPILFMGDLMKSLAHTVACFRWELNRSLKGAMWADPVEGGLTGIYFDYVNFFKKNPKLSTEAKEKIAERFKSIRTNRDRFAEDYTMWALFEKDGIMKLNTVVREMFYRYIPFRKDVREKLENMPAFSEIATKYKNIHTREVTGYQRRFKKYMDETGRYPEAIQRFMDFLDT